MDEDWDNLLILDACRFDMFERLNSVPGELQWRRSKGSATREFVQNNFAGKRFHDCVYVTGNPFVSMDASDAFHAVVDVWDAHWDDDLETVTPDTMREALFRAEAEYPNKRLVGHFVQPHHPFIGPTGRDLLGDTSGNRRARERALNMNSETADAPPNVERRVWQLAETGDLDLEMLRRAYDENLEVALPIVEELVETLRGKTVVTSDHGNLIDEPAYRVLSAGSRRFGHPMYATAEALVKVPWLVCRAETRKRVVSEPPTAQKRSASAGGAVVDDRLEALGYK
ncbi:hypothetical protein [Halegenticoccus soli]|uniref:hypothetical protein n=1 Tax=Halegenticoccus soli TaxID=1985678 RepID=UPI000C6E7D7D|nr:hypothetical protein [Halegenticoccus soli]